MRLHMDVTTDDMLGGRLRLAQPRNGYRAGMDAALLAAACDALPGSRVIEAGCGVGAALLAAATRCPSVSFVGVENDVSALAIGQDNIKANGMAGRVTILLGDIAKPFTERGEAPFDAALANPPYFDNPGVLRGPAPEKTNAWITKEGLASWAAFLVGSVKQGGVVTIIHRADRLADLVGLLSEKCGSIQIRPIQPFSDEPAKRVLVRAVKSGRTPLRLLPALVMHERHGAKHTLEADRILRGEEGLRWL